MTHPKPPAYSGAMSDSTWGTYAAFLKLYPEIVEGSGPWEGNYMGDGPHELRGEMHLHLDFDADGPTYDHADTICSGPANPDGVRNVNDLCGLKLNLDEWERRVVRHEQKHEDGANNCLVNGVAARTVIEDMERIAEDDRGDVVKALNDRFEAFLNSDAFIKAMATSASTPASPIICEHRFLGYWGKHSLLPATHLVTNGC